MKTDDLVKALAADAKSVEPPITRTLAVAIALGTVISLVCFLRALGVRPDFLQSMTDSGRFIFKFMLTLSVAVPGFVLLRGMSRPDFVPGNRLWWLALAPVLLSAAVAFELLGADRRVARPDDGPQLAQLSDDNTAPIVAAVRDRDLRAPLRRSSKSDNGRCHWRPALRGNCRDPLCQQLY